MYTVPQIQAHAVTSADMNTLPPLVPPLTTPFLFKREKGEEGKESYFTDTTFGPSQATMCLDHVLGEACCYPSASRPPGQQSSSGGLWGVEGDTC